MSVKEFHVAADFFAALLRRDNKVEEAKIFSFIQIFTFTLDNCYRKTWHPEQPLRGSGNRCIRIGASHFDPLLLEVAELAGITNVRSILPAELTFWVDPNCVCYKLNDYNPIFTLYGDKEVAVSPKIFPITVNSTSAKSSYTKCFVPPVQMISLATAVKA